LAAAHGQGGQRVLEYLLEGQELEHAQVDRGVETQAALVRADSAVHLHAVAAVDVNLAVIVHPRHAEHDDPLRLDQALDDARLEVLGVFFQERPQSGQYLFGCLVEFGLVWIAQRQVRQAGVQGVSHGSLFFASLRRNGANLSEASALWSSRERNFCTLSAVLLGGKSSATPAPGGGFVLLDDCVTRMFTDS